MLYLIIVIQNTSYNKAIKTENVVADSVATSIKKYTNVWDEIVNKRKPAMFTNSNFTKDVIINSNPNNIIGFENACAFFANYIFGIQQHTIYYTRLFIWGKN